MEKLILIDGNSLINRAFYANPPFTAPDGTPTGAVFGFTNMLFKLIIAENPSHIAVAFDVHHPTFRHEMYSEYKATRKPMPEELRSQIPLQKKVLNALNICVIELPGFEADDIIGTVAKATDVQTIIITGDRDSFQLVDNSTEVHFTKRGITDVDVLNAENFTEKTGITPIQVIDLKSLMGDGSDNIPGVKGIGEKTALSMVQKYGTLDNVYANIDDFTGKTREKLVENKETAYLSKTLATIDTHAPINVDLDKMKFSLPFSEDAKSLFLSLGFKILLDRQQYWTDKPPVDTEEVKADVELVTVDSVDKLPELKSKEYAVTFENTFNIYDGSKEYSLKFKENIFDEGLDFSSASPLIKKLFSKGNKLIVFGKKDLRHKLDDYGVEFNADVDDVSLMKYLVDYTGKEETLIDALSYYHYSNKMPAFGVYEICKNLSKKLTEQDMLPLYTDVELPLTDVLYDMEKTGFKVDVNTLNTLSDEFTKRMKESEARIHELAGDDKFNVNSPKQLGNILFEKMGLKYPKHKKATGYSTASEILEELTGEPIIDEIILYRQLSKIVSTYIEGFKSVIDRQTGLIHTSFNQTVTSTGRLSSKAPNLQNIPVRDEEGKVIRKVFVPSDSDRILVGADYSQIELRLLADFSDCKGLINGYSSGKDIHATTAARVFGVPLEKVTSTMRRDAKAVNFGIIYGISEYGLSKNIKTSTKQAKEYIQKYFAEYPEVKEYMDKNVALAHERSYLTTILNRRRYFPDINSSSYNLRQFSERAAMNFPLQGSSADIIKVAMIRVYERLKKEGLKSKLILQIHDELIVDTLKSEKDKVLSILREEMEGAANLKVRLTVDTESGETWFDAE